MFESTMPSCVASPSSSLVLLVLLLKLSLHLGLHDLLLLFKSAAVDLVHILPVCDFFFAAVRVLLVLTTMER